MLDGPHLNYTLSSDQDRDLERVSASVRGLLDISRGIHAELDAQDEMLGAMKRDLDSTHADIESTEQRTQEAVKNSRRCCLQ
jgi:t-SNARE complex subunit (syntaxin)